jgi:hypothetical protein
VEKRPYGCAHSAHRSNRRHGFFKDVKPHTGHTHTHTGPEFQSTWRGANARGTCGAFRLAGRGGGAMSFRPVRYIAYSQSTTYHIHTCDIRPVTCNPQPKALSKPGWQLVLGRGLVLVAAREETGPCEASGQTPAPGSQRNCTANRTKTPRRTPIELP